VIRNLFLTACSLVLALSGAASAGEPIKIGTTQALTGHYAEFGIEQLRGLQMWVADVNSRGALLGRPVELVHYDDGSRPYWGGRWNWCTTTTVPAAPAPRTV
jgi:branched-chain amino acid transport system substrate-binding protein